MPNIQMRMTGTPGSSNAMPQIQIPDSMAIVRVRCD
jgi:hypothetical protein